MTNKYQKADRFVCAHHINLWRKKPPINHSTYQTPNSEAKPPASSQTCLRAETEPYAAGRPEINRKQQNYATQPESSTTLGEFTTKKRETDSFGGLKSPREAGFRAPGCEFSYDSRCEHADARKGSKNASNRMRNGCGEELLLLALASAKAHALWERRVTGEGGLNSNLTTVNDLPLGLVLGLTLRRPRVVTYFLIRWIIK